MLRDEGKPELAQTVRKLFTELQNPDDEISLGMAQFEMNLARARFADLTRLQNNPNARRLEVEDAMIVTLRKNNIELLKTIVTVMSGFKPKFLLKK